MDMEVTAWMSRYHVINAEEDRRPFSRALSTVRAADLILVVEDGRIVERGTHAELVASGGRYEELYRTQFADAAPTPAG
jgi:hypothetical protein